MADNNTKVWLITGSSTGFGRALTEAVLKHGDRVVATARKPEQLQDLAAQHPDTVKAIRLDVTNPREVRACVSSALDAFGRIDVRMSIMLATALLVQSKRLAMMQFVASLRLMSLVR